jgi:hypothetical protein
MIFLTDLKLLSKYCEFGVINDSLIKDKIVIGINDSGMREKLLRVCNLDLNAAINFCLATEQSKIQIKELNVENHSDICNITSTKNKIKNFENHNGRNNYINTNSNQKLMINNCKFCGKSHLSGNCPAFNKICTKCNKKNHFALVCKSQHLVNTVESDLTNESYYVGSIINNEIIKLWLMDCVINGLSFKIQIDTGPQVNILPLKLYNKLITKPKLISSNAILKSYNGSIIHSLGYYYYRHK